MSENSSAKSYTAHSESGSEYDGSGYSSYSAAPSGSRTEYDEYGEYGEYGENDEYDEYDGSVYSADGSEASSAAALPNNYEKFGLREMRAQSKKIREAARFNVKLERGAEDIGAQPLCTSSVIAARW